MKKTIEENQKPDPSSPYYRVCLYQFCLKPFMKTDRDSEYCCKEHYDADYNRYQRIKGKNANEKDDTVSEIIVTPPIVEEILDVKSILKITIEVFSRLSIDEIDGSVYSIQFLENLGVDFRYPSYVFPLCNTENSFCVQFGPYDTFLISPTQVLIKFKNN